MAQKASPRKSAKTSPSKKGSAAAKKVSQPASKSQPAKTKKKAPAAPVKARVKAAAKKPVAAPVPARLQTPAKEAKKEKPAAPLTKSDFQYFRNLLLEKRREILGDVGSMESEAFKSGSNLSNMPIHMADVGTDNFEQEFTLGLIESERQFLRDIQEALVRIDSGTYGTCLGTGSPIPRVRLEAVPWAKYTIEYSRLLESGKIGRDNGSPGEDEGGDDDEE